MREALANLPIRKKSRWRREKKKKESTINMYWCKSTFVLEFVKSRKRVSYPQDPAII